MGDGDGDGDEAQELSDVGHSLLRGVRIWQIGLGSARTPRCPTRDARCHCAWAQGDG